MDYLKYDLTNEGSSEGWQMLLREIVEGFKQRIENIAVFLPLFELRQKRKYDYPLLELGIGVLLFILESMLRAEKDCTYQRISYFLQDLIAEYYDQQLDYEEALELTHYLVRESLLNQGRPHQFSYLNLESGEQKIYKFHLIELDDYQIEDQTVRLKLSAQGLELLFKTKELYNELQVSISQLYLRQQIQKGVFAGALKSVEELSLAVKNEKERLKQLEEQIIRDVLQVAKEEQYQTEMERINDQLDREKELFTELRELVAAAMEKYYANGSEEEALNQIRQVKKKLIEVISLHESLFAHKLRIEQLMQQSIDNMILNAFNTKINFETEFLEGVVRNDLEIKGLKKILDPIFSVQVNSEFNPHLIFNRQSLSRKKPPQEKSLWEIEEEELRAQEAWERRKQKEKEERLRKYLLLLLKPLLEEEEVELSKILSDLKRNEPKEYASLIKQWDFYPLLMELHQLGRIPLEKRGKSQALMVDDLFWVLTEIVESNEQLAQLEAFELRALDEVIELAEGYKISDFIIGRGDSDGV